MEVKEPNQYKFVKDEQLLIERLPPMEITELNPVKFVIKLPSIVTLPPISVQFG